MNQFAPHHRFTAKPRYKNNVPILFAICFGLIMLGIGLSQIFAASAVIFLMQPYSQTANANESKSLTVSLNSSGQQVDGGSVRVTYDPAQLSDIAFTEPANAAVSISNKVGTSGAFSFDFQISYGSQNNPSLGTFSVKAKSLGSTQAAYLKFDAAGTKAYQGFNNSRTFYPTTYGQAVIVIYASSTSTTPPVTPTPTPTGSSSPTASPTAPSPAGSQTPGSTATPPSASTPASNLNNFSGSEHDQAVILSSSVPNSPPVASKKKRIPPGVYILVGAIILMFGGVLFVYRRYVRDQPDKAHFYQQDLHRGLFDDKPKEPSEEVVVAPAAVTKPALTEKPAPQGPEPAKTHPAIITKSKEKLPAHKTAEAEAKPKPAHTPPAAPAVAHSTDHKVESKKPPAKKPLLEHKTVVAQPAVVKTVAPPSNHPVVSPHAKPLMPIHPQPTVSPLITPSPEANKPSNTPVAAKSPIPPNPGHHVPEWQTQLKVPHAVPKEDPPDMFELAAEHPESFGSSQLYEVETKEKEDDEKHKK